MNKDYRRTEAKLYEYNKLKFEINDLKMELSLLESEFGELHSSGFDERVSGGEAFSKTENEVVSKDIKVRHLNYLIIVKEIEQQRIENALSSLAGREKKIVELKYFKGLSNNDVARALYLSPGRISQIKSSTVKYLSRLIQN